MPEKEFKPREELEAKWIYICVKIDINKLKKT